MTRHRVVAGAAALLILIGIVVADAHPAAAATASWDGSEADDNWSTAANWAGNTVPVDGDDVVFPAGAAQLVSDNDLPSGRSFATVQIKAMGYDIKGSPIALTSGLTVDFPTTDALLPTRYRLATAIDGNVAFTTTSGSFVTIMGPISTTLTSIARFVSDGNTTVSGVIGGMGQLLKSGGGTLFLTGDNTYTGNTLVTGGTLVVDGQQQSSAVQVTQARLEGAGRTGAVTAIGSTVAPTLNEYLTVNGNVTLTNSALEVELGGTQPGVDQAALRVIGGVNLPNGATVTPVPRFTVQRGQVFTVIDNDSDDAVSGTFTDLDEGARFRRDGVTYQVSYEGGDGNDVTLTAVGVPAVVSAAGPGGAPQVVVSSRTGATRASFNAYDPGFGGGVNVAVGDVDGDGVDEIVTGAGPGGGPHVRAFEADGTPTGVSFFAYAPNMTAGVYVAAGDIDGDGTDEIVTGAGDGAGPHVRVFKGNTPVGGGFLAAGFPSTGARVAIGDIVKVDDDDVSDEIVVGTGPGAEVMIRVFRTSGEPFALRPAPYGAFAGGVRLAAADLDGDGFAEVIAGVGPGGGPHVQAFKGATLGSVVASFFAYNPAFTGGVSVGGFDLFGPDGAHAEMVTGAGPGGGPHVRLFSNDGTGIGDGFFPLAPNFPGGVRVASGSA